MSYKKEDSGKEAEKSTSGFLAYLWKCRNSKFC